MREIITREIIADRILWLLARHEEGLTIAEIAEKIGVSRDSATTGVYILAEDEFIVRAGVRRKATRPYGRAPYVWSLLSLENKAIATRPMALRDHILTLISERPMTSRELVNEIGVSPSAVGYRMKQLAADGVVERDGGPGGAWRMR